MPELRLRTGVWYGDELLRLALPPEWRVTVFWPATPPPLTDDQIAYALANPVGQPPLRELCRGRRRPVVIVDDLNRPTPANRVLPIVFDQFQEAGIAPGQVRILIATGTHEPPTPEAAGRKVGPEAARACEVVAHNALKNTKRIGRTSFGTPIEVNRVLTDSDFVLGIGGIYPNHTAGFGGGSKLALGVLGLRSIMGLHYGHQPVEWSNDPASTFRQELDEIALVIGLRTTVCLHVDANREVIRAVSGDQALYYADEASFVRRTFSTPEPVSADVVISNAYPNDVSLTFAAMKGFVPLSRCAPHTSRIGIASCSEGLGRHELVAPNSFGGKLRHVVRRLSIMTPGEAATKFASRIRGGLTRRGEEDGPTWPIWVYRPAPALKSLALPGMTVRNAWQDIIDAVTSEQGNKRELNVAVYPCAPLQCLGPVGTRVPRPEVKCSAGV
jgi:nickel-dependent lactate racemase